MLAPGSGESIPSDMTAYDLELDELQELGVPSERTLSVSPSSTADLDNLSDAALDELPYGVICLRRDGTILRYNLAEARLARLDRAVVLGRRFSWGAPRERARPLRSSGRPRSCGRERSLRRAARGVRGPVLRPLSLDPRLDADSLLPPSHGAISRAGVLQRLVVRHRDSRSAEAFVDQHQSGLSLKGMRIETSKPLQVGARLRLEVRIHGDALIAEGTAVVARATADDMWLEFLALEGSLVEELARRARPPGLHGR